MELMNTTLEMLDNHTMSTMLMNHTNMDHRNMDHTNMDHLDHVTHAMNHEKIDHKTPVTGHHGGSLVRTSIKAIINCILLLNVYFLY